MLGCEKEGKEDRWTKNACMTYIKCQDTLLSERHAFFDRHSVTDNRLSDGHITGNVNIIPDVGMIQVDIVS